MDIIVHPVANNGRNGQQRKKNSQKPAKQNNQPKPKQQRRRRQRNTRQGLSPNPADAQWFIDHIVYPDILGPFRQPRFGASNRTGLALIKGRGTLVGSGVNLVQGLQLIPVFSSGNQLSVLFAATETTTFTGATSTPGSVVFPSTTQVADVNLVSWAMTFEYLSPPINVAGQMLLGSCIPVTTASSYAAMYDYPTSTRLAISTLIDQPQRAFGRKLSERANEFVPVGTGYPDIDCPYIFTSGLPAGAIIGVDFTCCYEYRSTTSQGSIVPFENSGTSSYKFNNAFSEAVDTISQSHSAIGDAEPGWVEQILEGGYYYGGQAIKSAWKTGRNGAISQISKWMTNRIIGSGGRLSSAIGWRDEL